MLGSPTKRVQHLRYARGCPGALRSDYVIPTIALRSLFTGWKSTSFAHDFSHLALPAPPDFPPLDWLGSDFKL